MGKYITNKQSMGLINTIVRHRSTGGITDLVYRDIEIVSLEGNVIGNVGDVLDYLKFKPSEELTMLNSEYIKGNSYMLTLGQDEACVLIR